MPVCAASPKAGMRPEDQRLTTRLLEPLASSASVTEHSRFETFQRCKFTSRDNGDTIGRLH